MILNMIHSETKWQIFLDTLMLPVMYLLQGNLSDQPQRTHYWNYTCIPEIELLPRLESEKLLKLPGDDSASRRWFWGLPLLHMPIFGGWRQYYVLEPEDDSVDGWFIGWVIGKYSGVSHVSLRGPVRMLKDNRPVSFFAFKSEGNQIRIRLIGEGSLGESREYGKLPLL